MLPPHGVLPLSFLKTICDRSFNKDSNEADVSTFAGKLVSAVLKVLPHTVGHVKVAEIWRQSGLTWDQFIPKETVSEFLASNVRLKEGQPINF